MRRFLLSILLVISQYAYASAPPGDSAGRTLVFDSLRWDFGPIREMEGPVSHTFVAENRSERPVVIVEVTSTCGCTQPEFSRRPIRPGERTEIRVTYDPANRPGAFSRELAVFTADRQCVARLRIEGEVEGRERSIEERYPLDCGGGLRIEDNFHAFAYVYHGRPAMAEIGCVNTSDRLIEIALTPAKGIESGVLAVEYPHRLAPGEVGALRFTYALPTGSARYGTLRDLLRVSLLGAAVPERPVEIFLHGYAVEDPAQIAKEKAPKWHFSENIVKFGPLKHASAVTERCITLSNDGEGVLIIRAVELPEGVCCSLCTGQTLAPGSSCKVRLTLDPSVGDYGIWDGRMVVIANDPQRPMQSVRITAIIED